MESKPHIKLNTIKQKDKTITHKFNYGFGEDDDDISPDYSFMVKNFKVSLEEWHSDIETKRSEINEDLGITEHIDFILIKFQNQFDIKVEKMVKLTTS